MKMKTMEKVLLMERNEKAQYLFKKNYHELTFDQILRVEKYMYDLSHPVWKVVEVDGEKTHYEVSNVGQVRNTKTGLNMNLFRDKDGYSRVGVYVKNKTISSLVHRLVLKAFVPNPENKPEVNHIDANRSNNWVDNLEWCTRQENSDHAVKLGNTLKGIDNGNNVYTEDQIHQVCKMLCDGRIRAKTIADKTGVSGVTINNIYRRKSWTHISKDYKFPKRDFVFGTGNTNSRYSEDQIRKVCEMISKGIPANKISKETDVSRDMVYSIRDRETWTDVSRDYTFPDIDWTDPKNNPNYKYTVDQIKYACKLLEDVSKPFKEIAELSGVKMDTLDRICSGKQWTHVSKSYQIKSRRDRVVDNKSPETKRILELFANNCNQSDIWKTVMNEFDIPKRKAQTKVSEIKSRYKLL